MKALLPFALAVVLGFAADPQPQRAAGAFDVKVAPLQLDPAVASPEMGRYSLDKQYHGDLEATGKGEMLSGGDPSKGFGGYVAIERVNGKLKGRAGSFLLQHSGTMDKSGQRLDVAIIPGSGTGGLAGIAGKLLIVIEGGKHNYTLEYTLP